VGARWGSGLTEGALRPVGVVVALVLAKHSCRVPLVDDQEAVEEFAADAADETFGDRVGPRGLHRRRDCADVDRGEDGVEGGGPSGAHPRRHRPPHRRLADPAGPQPASGHSWRCSRMPASSSSSRSEPHLENAVYVNNLGAEGPDRVQPGPKPCSGPCLPPSLTRKLRTASPSRPESRRSSNVVPCTPRWTFTGATAGDPGGQRDPRAATAPDRPEPGCSTGPAEPRP